MKITFCAVAVLFSISTSMVSSLETTKSCAEYEITPMQDFVKESYVGNWFIHQLYDVPSNGDYPGTSQFDCVVLSKTLRPDGNYNFTEIIVNTNVLPEFRANGLATFNHTAEEGRYIFSSEDIPQYNGEYVILKTDYISYTIECKCTDLSGGGSEVELYIMSRAPLLPFRSQRKINRVIADHHFNDNPIRTLNILSCPSKLNGLLS